MKPKQQFWGSIAAEENTKAQAFDGFIGSVRQNLALDVWTDGLISRNYRLQRWLVVWSFPGANYHVWISEGRADTDRKCVSAGLLLLTKTIRNIFAKRHEANLKYKYLIENVMKIRFQLALLSLYSSIFSLFLFMYTYIYMSSVIFATYPNMNLLTVLFEYINIICEFF